MSNDAGRSRTRQALIVIAVPTLFLFRSILGGAEALYARDVFHQYWPLRMHATLAWKSGHLPLWDDGSQGGLPLLANIHAAVLYPFNAIYQFVSFPAGYGWLIALHTLILGWGLFAWFRSLGRSEWAAALGAMVFAASGPVLGLSAFGPNLMGLAWVPWFAHALSRRGPFAGRALQVAAAVALQSLCGDPMSVVFSALVGAVLVGLGAGRRRQLIVLGASGAVLGLLLAAPQLLPAYGLLGQTTRANAVDQLDWSMRPIRFFELFLPKLFGNFDGTPAFWGNFLAVGAIKTPFSLTVYAGAAAFAVALTGFFRATPTRAIAVTLAALGFVLALGGEFLAGPLLANVPPFSLFRYPEKYLVISLLGLALLVADGLDGLLEHWLAPQPLIALVVFGSLVLVAAVMLVAAPGSFVPWFETAWPGLPVEIPLETFRVAAFSCAALVACVALCSSVKNTSARCALVALLCVSDVVAANQAVIFTTPSELFTEQPPVVELVRRGAPVRPFRVWRNEAAMASIRLLTESAEQRMMQRAFDLLTLKSSLSTVFGLQELSGSSPVILSRWDEFILATQRNSAVFFSLFNTCFAIEPAEAGEAIYAPLPEGAAVKRLDCFPRLFSVASVLPLADRGAVFAHLARTAPSFSVREVALVEADGEPRRFEHVEITKLESRDGFLSARVRAGSTGGFVVFGTSYAKGWAALVDGVSAPMSIVDGAVMGVAVTPGDHQLEFSFHEPFLGVGVLLSALGVALCVALWVSRRTVSAHPFVS